MFADKNQKLRYLALCAAVALGTLNSSATANEPSAKDNHRDIIAVRRGYVDARYGQIHYRSVSPAGANVTRPPILLLHLSPNSGQVFSSFLPLIGRDRKAVAPDYPGYGMSDPIEGEQRISDYAAAMLDVVDKLDLKGPIDVLGYHTGAAVALEMAHQRPMLVRRLALVAVPVLTTEERKAGAALPPIPFDMDGEFAKKEWQRSWQWRGPGQSVESVLATFSAKMMPGVRDLGARAVLAYDIMPKLKSDTHDMLIVRINDDLWIPSARARDIKPEAKYVELPEFGHGVFHAAPERLDEILRGFLDSK